MKKLLLLLFLSLPFFASAQITATEAKAPFVKDSLIQPAHFIQIVDFIEQKADTSAGIPAGGATGQVLKKVDGTDYNVTWGNDNNSGGGAVDYTDVYYPEVYGVTGDGTTDDSGNFLTALQAARDDNKVLWTARGRTYSLPTMGSFSTSGAGDTIRIMGGGTLDFGASTSWFLDINHSGSVVEINGINFTGGALGANAGSYGGLIQYDNTITSSESLIVKNVKSDGGVCLLWANFGGTANRQIKHMEFENIRLENMQWRGIIYTGEQPTYASFENIYGTNLKNFLINLGDESYVSGYDSEEVYLSLNRIYGTDISSFGTSEQANVLKIQGYRDVNVSNFYAARMTTTTNDDSEGLYGKITSGNFVNIFVYDCLGEAAIGFKGVSRLNSAGTGSGENDMITMKNVHVRFTPTWIAAHTGVERRGILYKTDNLDADGIWVDGADIGVQLFANNDANYDLGPDDGDLIYGSVNITNLHVNNYSQYAFEANSNKMKSLQVHGFASNFTGTADGNDILVAWARGDTDYVKLDFTVSRLTANVNNNDLYRIKQESGTKGEWDLIARGDRIGRIVSADRGVAGVSGTINIWNHAKETDESQLHTYTNGSSATYKVKYHKGGTGFEMYKPFQAPSSGTAPVSLDVDYNEPWPVYRFNTSSTNDIQLAPINRTEIGQKVAYYINNDQASAVNVILPSGDRGVGNITTQTISLPAGGQLYLVNEVLATDNTTTTIYNQWSGGVLTAAF